MPLAHSLLRKNARTIFALLVLLTNAPVRAASYFDINSPFDYSLAPYFPLEAALPDAYRGALDTRNIIGITQIAIDAGSIAVGDQTLMSRPIEACSIYYSVACYDVEALYKPDFPQIVFTGMVSLSSDLYIPFGLNTGYSSEKLNVAPSVLLGIASRIYTRDDKSAQLVIEYGRWLNSNVKHTPCVDDYGNQFYCENLLAWSDFTYDAHQRSEYVILTYVKLF